MDKIKLEVPLGIRYISNWKDFDFKNFPNKCIINKQLPGCGFTSWVITSVDWNILCSPRKILLDNKAEQHFNVFLVKNELEEDTAVDEDLSKPGNPTMLSKSEESEKKDSKTSNNFFRIHNQLRIYLENCQNNGIAPKILVTYDSFRIVKDILKMEGLFWNFNIIVDEFQTILHDSRFKATTELEFISTLRDCRNTYFVSATPMLDKYLEMLEEFKDLPYYELDWGVLDSSRIIKPNLKVLSMTSISSQAETIINSYKRGDFERAIRVDKETGEIIEVVSDEAVFYVNSVNHIISIIKRNGLGPDEVNILCSNTESNQKKIWKRLGKRYNIGTVPLREVKPKMFTLCTRTVYLGADFYSLCAKSFIFSDSNYDCLAVDISQDLPQILGRQRLENNPWKNQATFYYRVTCDYRKISQSMFDNLIRLKKEETLNLLKAYDIIDETEYSVRKALAKKYYNSALLGKYKDDYVAVNTHGGTCMKPVFNNLVYISDIRAYEIQQVDYKDRFSVFCTINSEIEQSDNVSFEVEAFFKGFENLLTFYEKSKYLCNYNFSSKEVEDLIIYQLDEKFKSIIYALGKEKIKALGYNITKINKELGIVVFDESNLGNNIRSFFNLGEKYTLSDLKSKLKDLYEKIGYEKVPKANDIEKYFEVKEYMVTLEINGVKKRAKGYELINYKTK